MMQNKTLRFLIASLVTAAAFLTASPAQGWQNPDDQNPDRAARSFRSPLLEGLRNSVEDSALIQDSGAESTLLNQLKLADQILADARAQNRYGLKLASRQARVGIAATSPNILLITVDRLALGDPGCCGQETIRTPAIDRLATEGLRFTRWYSGAPESLPSRWSLLTGKMLHQVPQNVRNRFQVKDAQVTMAEALWKAGYLTAFFGLWNNGDNPQAHGFENWSGFFDAKTACNEFPESIHVDGARVRIVENAGEGKRVSRGRMISSELRAWLQHQRQQRRQFFVHLSVSAFSDLEASKSTQSLSASEYQNRVEAADRFIGQMIDTLEESGLSRQTLVVVTAESGPHPRCHAAVKELGSPGEARTSAQGLRDGDLLVPCVVRWPGRVAPGRTTDRVCSVLDLMSTFLTIAMARDHPATDGVSLQPVLLGRSQKTHPLLYWRSRRGGTVHQAAWKDGWKAFKAGDSQQVNLFRMSDDPGERVDRAREFPDILAGLIKR